MTDAESPCPFDRSALGFAVTITLRVVLCSTFLGSTVGKASLSDFDLTAVPADGPGLIRLREEVEFALAGLRASRECLERAQYQLTEDRVEVNAERETLYHSVYTVAFDYGKRVLRCEFQQTEPWPSPVLFTYIENGEEAFMWNHQGSFSIVTPGYLNGSGWPPPDIRPIGTGLYYNYVDRGRYKYGLDVLEKALLERAQFVDILSRDERLSIDYFPLSALNCRFRLVLDRSRGWVPIELESIVVDPTSGKWRKDQLTTTTWMQYDGVWLPDTLTSSIEIPQRHLALHFHWLSVNEALDQKQFTRESVKLPNGTYVADMTLTPNRPTLVEIVGQPKGDDYSGSRIGRGNGRTIIIGINVAALLALVIAALYRSLSRSSRDGTER